MNVPISDAKAVLADLVRRAEAGEEVVLTRHGTAVARIEPVKPKRDEAKLALVLDRIIAEARANPSPGPYAARSADFLYDEDGLPG